MTSSVSGQMEPPPKRLKLSPPSVTSTSTHSTQRQSLNQPVKMEEFLKAQEPVSAIDAQEQREHEAGIYHFVNTMNSGFSGILKKRYTDFIVNEIAPDGTVFHLTDDRAPTFKFANNEPDRQANQQAPKSLLDVNGSQSARVAVKPANADAPASEIKVESVDTTTAPIFTKAKDLDATTTTPPTEVISVANVNEEKPKPSDVQVLEVASKPSFVLGAEDEAKLVKHLGVDFKDEIVKFHEKILSKPDAKPGVFGFLLSDPITDRALRGELHADIRRIFESRLETESIDKGNIKFTVASKQAMQGYMGLQSNWGNARDQNPRNQRHQGQAKGKLGWQELGGEYLHFSLYKENKDTMEVLGWLCKSLNLKPRSFSFAGTKDRRATTVQRVSVFRQQASALARLNNTLKVGSRIGDFKYEKHGLELGELAGNFFVVTLRDCRFGEDSELDDTARLQLANDVVASAVEHVQNHGFINYFGLQRFGTFGIGTDVVGKLILKEDFKGAVEAILTYTGESLLGTLDSKVFGPTDKIGRDDILRAKAINLFQTTGRGQEALNMMPRKFSAECSIIRYMSMKNHISDYIGALLMIPRGLRTMYVHAYQSLVWNMAASERWSRYGSKVVKGDLVLVDSPAVTAAATQDEVDENGEIVVRPAVDDIAVHRDDIYERARALTLEEAQSGKYSIFDIVLPTPGFDINYPDNEIGDFYKEFMGSERGGGLDPADMRRRQKDFSLSGSYRKFLATVGKDMSFEVKTYHDDLEQLVETDLEKIMKTRPQPLNNFNNQASRFNNGPSNNENNPNNTGRQNSRGRGTGFGSNQRGGYKYTSGSSNGTSYTADSRYAAQDAVSARVLAWQNFSNEVGALEKAEREAAKLKELTRPEFNPATIKQPEYRETYIPTSFDGEVRRVGKRLTQIRGEDGVLRDITQEHLKVEENTAIGIDSEVPAFTSPAPEEAHIKDESGTEVTKESFMSSTSSRDTKEGGVQLNTSNKRPAEEMSAAPTAEVGTILVNKAVQTEADFDTASVPAGTSDFEELKPAKIAVIIKFALGSSQYATMTLREMTSGSITQYKPDFSSGR